MKNHSLIIFGLVVHGLCVQTTRASMVFDNSGVTANQYGPYSIGLDFTVVTPGYVTSVGLFDANGDGFGAESIPVAIFSLDGSQVLGTAYSFTGNGDQFSNGSRIHNITPVFLPAGSYSIVAGGFVSNPEWNMWYGGAPQPTFNDLGGALSLPLGQNRWDSDISSLHLPQMSVYWGDHSSPVFAAGTFDFTPVPEPSTYLAGTLLLLPFGTTALRMLRKNRKA